MNLNEIKHSKRKNIDYQIRPKFICQYIFCFVTKSSVIDQTASYNYYPPPPPPQLNERKGPIS